MLHRAHLSHLSFVGEEDVKKVSDAIRLARRHRAGMAVNVSNRKVLKFKNKK